MSEFERDGAGSGHEALVRASVRMWRDKLINLTGSNRLLNFRARKTSAVTILSPNAADVTRALDSKARFEFRPPADDEIGSDGDETADPELLPKARRAKHLLHTENPRKELSNALRNLQRRSNQEYLDRGLWVLYLAVGALKWDDESGAKFTSPLLLLPVELVSQGPKQLPYLQAVDEEPTVNPALALKLGQLDIVLPTTEELEDVDPAAHLEKFRAPVARMKTWSVDDALILSYFTFAKEAMYRDLLDNELRISEHPAVTALAAGGRGGEVNDFHFDPIPDAEIDQRAAADKTPLVLDADSSQRACVAAAIEGRSFVMDGPPGTGKSQTIANMIGGLLHAGRSVLFVSEKAAALDVVRNRLTDVGLGPYLLELHSHKATRKQVAGALGEALDFRPVPPAGMNSTDLDQLTHHQRELNRYAVAMNADRHPLQQSLHAVLGWISNLHAVPSAPLTGIAPTELTTGGLTEVRRAAQALARAWRPASQGSSFAWRGIIERRPLESRLHTAAYSLKQLRSIAEANAELAEAFNVQRLDTVRLGASLLKSVAERPRRVPDKWLTTTDVANLQAKVQRVAWLLRDLAAKRDILAERAGVDWCRLPSQSEVPALDLGAHLRSDPAPIGVSDFDSAQAAEVADHLESDMVMLKQRTESLRFVAGQLAMPVPATFDQADRVLALAELASLPNRPERHWLTDGTERSRRARQELDTAARKLTTAETDGFAYYQADLLEHDVAGLRQRFVGKHRGLKKALSAYRKDKKEVLAFAQSDVHPQDAVAKLDLAIAWKEASEQYHALEQEHAHQLGSYYTGRSTDYGRIDAAFAAADAAVRLCGDTDVAAVAARIDRDAIIDPTLTSTANATSRDTQDWGARLAAPPAPQPRPELRTGSISDAVDWLQAQIVTLRSASCLTQELSRAVGRELTYAEADELLALRATGDEAAAALAQEETTSRDVCGDLYDGDRTTPEDLEAALTWTVAARSTATGTDQPLDSVQTAAFRDAPPLPALEGAIDTWEQSRQAVLEAFDDDRRPQLLEEFGEWADAEDLLASLREDELGQQEWFSYQDSRRVLADYDLDRTIDFCITDRIAPDDIPRVLEKSLLREWADHHIANDPDLSLTRAEDRDQVVVEYRTLDEKLISSAAGQILQECNARRPRTAMGQSGIIRREADKKRRHMPVRQLLERTNTVTQAIKPCFMMSPLAVSQYIPGNMSFDVVIFDEASQVAPQDAINCVYRGTSLVMAGDQKQLPPTNFFTGIEDDGEEWSEESDDASDFESVLDLAKSSGAYVSLTLSWHYRSRHENLIAFSNASFYKGKLITFPGAEHEGPDVGVEFVPANGKYRRGTSKDNPIEAAKVVERIIHHFETRPDRSLGVVTFSESQATMIESVLENARHDRPDLEEFFTSDRLDGFFVKNLESVQGDERDVMIFSLGYGPDEHGKFTYNFGPVTRDGGWRRLNVAVTRARFRNEIVASFRASDIPESGRSEGTRHLRRYLDFAERGTAALALDVSEGGDAESPFEESVISVVRSWGYDVVPQVGAVGYRIDLGVRHPGQPGVFMLGIECDGFRYHSSKTARDRDRLREQVLSGLGWRLHRIWGTAWYRNRNLAEQRLREALEHAAQAPVRGLLAGRDGERPASTERSSITVEPVVHDEIPSWTMPYRTVDLADRPYWLDLSDNSSRYHLRKPLAEIVKAEEPIHLDVLHQRIRDCWGVGRIGSRIRTNISEAIRLAQMVRDGDFVRSTPDGPVDVRTPSTDCDRTIDQVHDLELTKAIVGVVRDAGAITENELTQATAKIYGWNRRGADIASRLGQLVRALLRDGVVTKSGGEITLFVRSSDSDG